MLILIFIYLFGTAKGDIMNNLKNRIPLLLILLSILFVCVSCEGRNEQEAYYRFSSQDKKRLLPYKEGQVLKFYNQTNEERTFTIYAINTSLKTQYKVGMGFFGGSAASYFYYDEKRITFFDSIGIPHRIYFQRWPLNTDLAKENRYTEYPSKFSASINYLGDYIQSYTKLK